MKRSSPETSLQISIIQWLDLACPDVLSFHCPNGGARTVTEGAIFKQMGVRAGMPDIMMIWKGGQYTEYGAIELKAGKGKTSSSQDSMLSKMSGLGVKCAVCYSREDVIKYVKEWGIPYNKSIMETTERFPSMKASYIMGMQHFKISKD